MPERFEALDGNEAVARVAYALSEVIAIYPITPSSPMGEEADLWSSEGRPNLWGAVPTVVEMQSEAGAAGVLHGALSTGALAATFTSSQGLLLMIPEMYKIAGELSPAVIHAAARSVATHALSIFGDHSDVMAARATGFAMLASGSVQEAMDLALVAHAAALESRVPFLHFFDGFRTSHEIQKVALLEEGDLRALMDPAALLAHRRRALSPEHPTLRGSSQNPDVFFQSREAANPFYRDCPQVVERVLERLAARTGREYRLFDYLGAPDAERVLVLMGSGAGAAEEAVKALHERGEKVGLLKVRLYRPFSWTRFVSALPAGARRIAVLDRTKEPGSVGEPLFLDVLAAIEEAQVHGPPRVRPKVIGGRYGLSSKEFTPAMAAAVFAELARESPGSRFTVGIRDDLGGVSLPWDGSFSTESPGARRAVFFGLGSDGTVGATKSAIGIIAERTGLNVQGYFVYDSKKAGAMTVSHLRFGPEPIRSSTLIRSADFVACHHEGLLKSADVLGLAAPGASFLLNIPEPERAWERLPAGARRAILAKGLRLFAIDASGVAREAGLGQRINTVMQTCFFHLIGLVPGFMAAIQDSIRKAYAGKGEKAVEANLRAVEAALSRLREVPVPAETLPEEEAQAPPPGASEFVKRVTWELLAGRGEELPVSALPPDGAYPTGTACFEKRAIAAEIPLWAPSLCIQCNKCALVCPHSAIRVKAYPEGALQWAPPGFLSLPWKGREFGPQTRYTVQTAPEDCTGCGLCVEICPALDKTTGRKALGMSPLEPARAREKAGFEFFLSLPEADRAAVPRTVKGSQLLEPLFEFPGACAGCGETPYLKLLTQLFGERLLVANATGCSSIYGGNLPTTPWTRNSQGRGPAWSNSLFEDNAEFGLGFRLALDSQRAYAESLLRRFADRVGADLVAGILEAPSDEAHIPLQRGRLEELGRRLEGAPEPEARDLRRLAEALLPKSVWIVGGDGWAYDIGFGGLDHVLRSGRDVNILVLDTEVYSNTGGQASKATPRGAVAKFASRGKGSARKDLLLHAIEQEGVYAARVALGASDTQTLRAFLEAEAFPGPSLIVAYSPCIAHGIEMSKGLEQQRLAVACGYWPLLRYNPADASKGQNPLQLDSKPPQIPFEEYAYRENRYRRLKDSHPEEARRLLELARRDIQETWRRLEEIRKRGA